MKKKSTLYPETQKLKDMLDEAFPTPYSCKVLQECIELQTRKAHDYQNPNSSVKQIDYYPHGMISLYDIMNAKLLRIRSLMESGVTPNHEGIDDSLRDLINYASFAVAYNAGKIPGQDGKK
jgi:hypothetical protein